MEKTLRKICAIFLYEKDYNMDLKGKMVIQFFKHSSTKNRRTVPM